MSTINKNIKQFLKNDEQSKSLIKGSNKNPLKSYYPLRSHFHFKISYNYLKRFISKKI